MPAKNDRGVTVGDAERLYGSFGRSTCGRIINRAKEIVGLADDVETDLAEALDYQNCLAHKFFIVHDADLLPHKGRNALRDELIDIIGSSSHSMVVWTSSANPPGKASVSPKDGLSSDSRH